MRISSLTRILMGGNKTDISQHLNTPVNWVVKLNLTKPK